MLFMFIADECAHYKSLPALNYKLIRNAPVDLLDTGIRRFVLIGSLIMGDWLAHTWLVHVQ